MLYYHKTSLQINEVIHVTPSKNIVHSIRFCSLCCNYGVIGMLVGCYLLGCLSTMIELNQVVIGYQNSAVTLPLSGTLKKGSLTAVIGANGAGKSTFLKTLAGLQPALAGKIHFSPLLTKQQPWLAYLPQHAELDRDFPITVYDLVAMGGGARSGLFGRISRQLHQQVEQALITTGIEALAANLVGELSGGQLQRALFARLLVQQAPLIMLDEPFTGIDSQTTALLLKVINGWHQDGKTVVAVLHDMAMVEQHFPDVLFLSQQCNLWGSAQEVLQHFPHRNHACLAKNSFTPDVMAIS
jgi:zinc/manganese transport system ATP-binding protein